MPAPVTLRALLFLIGLLVCFAEVLPAQAAGIRAGNRFFQAFQRNLPIDPDDFRIPADECTEINTAEELVPEQRTFLEGPDQLETHARLFENIVHCDAVLLTDSTQIVSVLPSGCNG